MKYFRIIIGAISLCFLVNVSVFSQDLFRQDYKKIPPGRDVRSKHILYSPQEALKNAGTGRIDLEKVGKKIGEKSSSDISDGEKKEVAIKLGVTPESKRINPGWTTGNSSYYSIDYFDVDGDFIGTKHIKISHPIGTDDSSTTIWWTDKDGNKVEKEEPPVQGAKRLTDEEYEVVGKYFSEAEWGAMHDAYLQIAHRYGGWTTDYYDEEGNFLGSCHYHWDMATEKWTWKDKDENVIEVVIKNREGRERISWNERKEVMGIFGIDPGFKKTNLGWTTGNSSYYSIDYFDVDGGFIGTKHIKISHPIGSDESSTTIWWTDREGNRLETDDMNHDISTCK